MLHIPILSIGRLDLADSPDDPDQNLSMINGSREGELIKYIRNVHRVISALNFVDMAQQATWLLESQ